MRRLPNLQPLQQSHTRPPSVVGRPKCSNTMRRANQRRLNHDQVDYDQNTTYEKQAYAHNKVPTLTGQGQRRHCVRLQQEGNYARRIPERDICMPFLWRYPVMPIC